MAQYSDPAAATGKAAPKGGATPVEAD